MTEENTTEEVTEETTDEAVDAATDEVAWYDIPLFTGDPGGHVLHDSAPAPASQFAAAVTKNVS